MSWEIVDRGSNREAIVHTAHWNDDPDDALVATDYYIDRQDPGNIGWASRSTYVNVPEDDPGAYSGEGFRSDGLDDNWWTLIPDVPAHVQLQARLMQEAIDSLRDQTIPTRGE